MKKLVLFKKKKERVEQRKNLAIELQVKTQQSDIYRQVTSALMLAMKECDNVEDAKILQTAHEQVLIIRHRIADERKVITDKIAEFK